MTLYRKLVQSPDGDFGVCSNCESVLRIRQGWQENDDMAVVLSCSSCNEIFAETVVESEMLNLTGTLASNGIVLP